ncbi:L,D-transpeptidase family protein [Mucilaginibacter pocheonensis]|uniref:Murein L,D-transpeptidase YcbB/YkuD n=1 Tax=Mucilaginibacter pocheonensis TaxID=398050 RepID=A0ABU1TFR1_9SPHI|nr:L,D-transpeptidase family protein [Mucilaginibacter pocheonensis]MDR6944260.1 murein L,D-transpeptidase YcbB/YkuD [Mucilaginibacter pocheonensis]
MIFAFLKKTTVLVWLCALFTILLVFQSCKKKHSEIADRLFEATQNEVFKDIDPDTLAETLKKEISERKLKIANASVIESYFRENDYQPIFVINHLFNGDLDILPEYYDKISEHGLDKTPYHSEAIKALIAKLHNKTAIKTTAEAYHDLAELELLSTSSLIKYANALQYGVINPKKIYSRYFTATKRPDTTFMKHALKANDIKSYLDSIQPADPQYKALQKAFLSNAVIDGLSPEESKRYLLVNLERLRWKNKPSEDKYVIVNIPDFRLDVIENGKSVLNMKVCVGEGRNKDYHSSLIAYADSEKYDKPFPRETPQLSSMIHSVQVNPMWNIPRSIATKEIITEAANDPYYLSNKNIDVYKDGVKIEDPETIDWSTVTKDNLEYDFKQRPGADNSLGKIKFLFKNRSSVYLHDTPAKEAFGHAMRAVSHGCVRLGDPLGLAKNLFGEGEDFDTISKDMNEDNPDPTNIGLPKKAPIYITYVTCWADDNGSLQYRRDVYGLDIVLYAHLKMLMSNL